MKYKKLVRIIYRPLIGPMLFAVFFAAVNSLVAAEQDLVRVNKISDFSFPQTVEQLKEAVKAEGFVIVNITDYQAMLATRGVKIKASQIIWVFPFPFGKLIFERNARASIEASLRIAVRETEDGRTIVSYFKPSSIFSRYQGLEELGKKLDTTMEAMVNKATVELPSFGGGCC